MTHSIIFFTEKIDSQLNRKYRFPLYEKNSQLTDSLHHFSKGRRKTSNQRSSVGANQRSSNMLGISPDWPWKFVALVIKLYITHK
jgi:hypothetical protein